VEKQAEIVGNEGIEGCHKKKENVH